MRSRALAGLLAAVLAWGADFRVALPGYHYEFPRDHFNHPDYRTEWWYFTGNVHTAEGRRFGYELTFFRQALEPEPAKGVWDVRDVWLAHLALSDLDGRRFLHAERLNRTGPGLAGADLDLAKIWNGNWSVRWTLDAKAPGGVAQQQLEAVEERFRLSLSLKPEKAPVTHGQDGLSRKAEGEGRASLYVSYTRLATAGTIMLDGATYRVEGLSWMDHEIFTHSLSANESGWDWFSMQFDDGTELMLYRLRRKDGSVEPLSSGTYIDAQGRNRYLALRDFALEPGRVWKSPETGASYPVEWKVKVPSVGIDSRVTTRLDGQELRGKVRSAPVYWEGAVDITGTRRGSGYLEMTGYAGAVRLSE
jgi:predicted secreted hydrolase